MTPAVLYAPAAYWALSREARKALTNGCGPGGWLNKVVPDTIYGLSVKPACDIHDFMYAVGQTMADKEEADDVFRNNLVRLIEAGTPTHWLFRPLLRARLRRVETYFLAVHHLGGPAFWKDKNPPETLGAPVLRPQPA